MVDATRGRGILTGTDREWLRAQSNGSTTGTSPQRDHQRRNAIRNRITNAILDFQLLTEELPDVVLRAVLEDLRQEHSSLSPTLSPVIAFLYTLANERAYLATGITMGEQAGTARCLTFEDAVCDGLAMAKQKRDWFRDPPFDISISSNASLYEIPPMDSVSTEEIFEQWKEYGHWRDPGTNEKLYESDNYTPSEAKAIALGNVKGAIADIQSESETSRLSVPQHFEQSVNEDKQKHRTDK